MQRYLVYLSYFPERETEAQKGQGGTRSHTAAGRWADL